jgi:hypothetical protein
MGLRVRLHERPLLSQFAVLGIACVGVEKEVLYDNVVGENYMASFVRSKESDRLQRKLLSPGPGTIQAVSWMV